MPSTYTASLRTEQQAALENDTTWGTKANATFQQLEDAIAGYVSVSHPDTASYTLTALNGTTDEARNMYIKITSALTAQRNVICPTAEKLYFVENATTGGFSIVFKTAAGSGITIPAGKVRVVMCDGTNVVDAITDFPSGATIAADTIVTQTGTQTLTNKTITINDSLFTIQDNVDTTKKAQFQLSGITTSTTRTYTLPDISDTLVSVTGLHTLQNKILDNTNTVTLKDTLLTVQDDGDTTKQVKFQLSGLTTATTRTWSFPDATDTFVGLTATQTITNKTIGTTNSVAVQDTLFTVVDNLDNTKQMQFQLSGLTTATTRTWTFPDATDTFVGLAATQTVTNKTLDNTTTLTVKDTLFTLQDDGDTTKQVKFQLSGLTTATTRTLTVPDVNDTILTSTGSGASLTGIRKQGKETIWVSASAMQPPVTNGATVGSTEGANFSYRTLDFTSANNKIAYFNVAMPKSWNLGTITFIPYWVASAGTAAQTCTWSLNAVGISDNDTFDSAPGTAQTSADSFISTSVLHVGPESAAITVAGTLAAGDLVEFKISRTAGTLTGDGKLVGIKILYTTNAADDT